MSDAAAIQAIDSPATLIAVAYEIETDAVERYKLLAEQMETHNNPELVRIFLDLARAEGLHAEQIRRAAGDLGVEARRGPIGAWRTDSPESADLSSAHYLMRPRDALLMALAGEQRALAFYTELAAASNDALVKKLAADFAEEEREHVELCHRLLLRYSPTAGAADADDPDPPLAVD
ncbi:MAG TPA: ferritin family protein [Steroidobacteraceae bacterium]|nr:ferritin family protein [Steroidobacteraceae bacterium]